MSVMMIGMIGSSQNLKAMLIVIGAVSILSGVAQSADRDVRDIAETLFNADEKYPVDYSGLNLSFLDLAKLDFKHARLDDSHLLASDLTSANLSHCSLRGAVLDRATLIRADFSGADLTGAKIRLPHSSGSPGFDAAATPDFTRANLKGARIVGRFDGGKFRQANLEDANLGPYGDWTQNTPARRLRIVSGDFTGANLVRANLSEATLVFTQFTNANLAHADLKQADLTGADFAGANLSGAHVDGANFSGARLRDAMGLDKVLGKERALNWPSYSNRSR